MTGGPVPVPDIRFSHTVITVKDMDRALDFYRDLLGMDIVFDQRISGGGFDTALGSDGSGNEGRAVGGVLGGIGIELLSVAGDARDEPSKPKRGKGGFVEFPNGARNPAEFHRNSHGRE